VCAGSGINKPVAVRDWLSKTKPQEDYIMVIDSDTIMRVPFDVEQLGLKPGKSPPPQKKTHSRSNTRCVLRTPMSPSYFRSGEDVAV